MKTGYITTGRLIARVSRLYFDDEVVNYFIMGDTSVN